MKKDPAIFAVGTVETVPQIYSMSRAVHHTVDADEEGFKLVGGDFVLVPPAPAKFTQPPPFCDDANTTTTTSLPPPPPSPPTPPISHLHRYLHNYYSD